MIFSLSKSANAIKNFLSSPVLIIFATVSVFVLVAPMLFNNIYKDYRLIPYFNQDEGYGRDLAWYYYSGEKLDTFQYSLDYGIEYQLIVDLFARPLGIFTTLTPNLILLIIRLFHFMCGLLSILFLWKFTKRHFSSFWIPTVTCISLILSHQFVWWVDNVKPEPFLVLLVVLSLDYTLRMIDKPSWKNIIFATFFAAFAFSVKLIGIFLLAPILFSILAYSIWKNGMIKRNVLLKRIKQFAIISVFILILLLLLLSFFIKEGGRLYLKIKSDNLDLEEFASTFILAKNMQILINIFLIFIIIGSLAFITYLYRKNKDSSSNKLKSILPLFIIFTFVTGYRFTFNVFGWFVTYARWLHQQRSAPLNFFLKPSAIQVVTDLLNNLNSWIHIFIQQDCLGISGIILLTSYFAIEIFSRNWREEKERKRFLKRMALLSYCFTFVIFILLFQSRHIGHHLITIVILFLLLSFEGIRILYIKLRFRRNLLLITLPIFFLLICFNFLERGAEMIGRRIEKLDQKNDIVYESGDWLKSNFKPNTKIVADAPWNVYVPEDFKNVIYVKPRLFMDIHFKENLVRLREILETEKPLLVIYNEYSEENYISPSLNEFLPQNRFRKIREFKRITGREKEFRKDKIEIYEVLK